ncbi:hypothetical protein ON010_g10388 [Phytophthora cinnamomi]|nr:hypothetical protein ON010_g10388 [Phytophthora cinnamomi]
MARLRCLYNVVFTGARDMDESIYLTTANTIPGATPGDYVQCLHDSLQCGLSDSSPVRRNLSALDGGGIRLELGMTIHFLQCTWVVKYAFDLDPVLSERIDTVESKLRDQQDALDGVRGELNAIQTPPFICLQATYITQYSRLCWNNADCVEFTASGDDGIIKIHRQGVYKIGGVVNSAHKSYDQTIRLLKNGWCIQQSYCAYMGNNRYVATPYLEHYAGTNKERIKAAQKRYYQRTRDARLSYQKSYDDMNREQIRARKHWQKQTRKTLPSVVHATNELTSN